MDTKQFPFRKYKAVLLSALCIVLPGLVFSASTPSPKNSGPFFEPDLLEETKNMNIFQVTIDPRHRTSLSAEIVSTVIKLTKKMGSTITKGELLIQLDDVLYKSNLEKAQAALVKAKTELDAKKQLFNDNQGSLFELKEGEANLATANADLALAQRNFDATKIIAPYDGKVISVEIEEFETPQLGKNLIEIVDDKILIAKFLIPSSYLPKIKIGMPFQIEIRETGEKIPATITRIGSIIDPSSGTVKIESDIDNTGDKLRAGMTGKAIFQEDEKK